MRAHEPYPAIVFDRQWNIVLANRGVEPFFALVEPDLLRPPVNLLRLGLHPRGFARLIVNLGDVRAVFRNRIARQLAVAPDPALAAIYEELLAPGPGEPAEERVGADVVLPMIIRMDGRELRLFSTITTFGTPMDITLDEVAIESYYPADARTAAFFEEADSGSRGQRRGGSM
ncbi:MmyB family transcriptional regulator [Winogradskya humida]|uniref:MmyB family transcriptional regulator n=1 Tax=Winogradskya humida TaxID=113566 RepID=UPI003F692636